MRICNCETPHCVCDTDAYARVAYDAQKGPLCPSWEHTPDAEKDRWRKVASAIINKMADNCVLL